MTDNAAKQLLQRDRLIYFWDVKHLWIIFMLLDDAYAKEPIVKNFAYKNLMKLKAEQANFYIFQFFQILNGEMSKMIKMFFLDYAKRSPLFSHQLIWQCKVEEKAKLEDDLKFHLHVKKRNEAILLTRKIIQNFSIFEKNVFEDLDTFLNSVTNISSQMRPSMSTDEKKSVIARCLENISIPQFAYLPTNPTYRVVEIVKGSGKPMQSAAKCPFFLSFICEPFDGIDSVIGGMRNKNGESNDINDSMEERPSARLEVRTLEVNLRSQRFFDKYIYNGEHTPHGSKTDFTSPHPSGSNHPKQPKIDNYMSAKQGTITPSKIEPMKNGASGNGSSIKSSSEFKFSKVELKNFEKIALKVLAKQTPEVVDERSKTIVSLEDSKMSLNTDQLFNKSKAEYLDYQVPMPNGRKKISCIFKTKDDIRQDSLTLQFITILKSIFAKEKVELFLAPYNTFSNRTGDVS